MESSQTLPAQTGDMRTQDKTSRRMSQSGGRVQYADQSLQADTCTVDEAYRCRASQCPAKPPTTALLAQPVPSQGLIDNQQMRLHHQHHRQ